MKARKAVLDETYFTYECRAQSEIRRNVICYKTYVKSGPEQKMTKRLYIYNYCYEF